LRTLVYLKILNIGLTCDTLRNFQINAKSSQSDLADYFLLIYRKRRDSWILIQPWYCDF